jgi:hypothetical protein
MISPEDWIDFQVGRFSLTAEDFGAYQKFIQQVCLQSKCSPEQRKQIKKMMDMIDVFKKKMESIK